MLFCCFYLTAEYEKKSFTIYPAVLIVSFFLLHALLIFFIFPGTLWKHFTRSAEKILYASTCSFLGFYFLLFPWRLSCTSLHWLTVLQLFFQRTESLTFHHLPSIITCSLPGTRVWGQECDWEVFDEASGHLYYTSLPADVFCWMILEFLLKPVKINSMKNFKACEVGKAGGMRCLICVIYVTAEPRDPTRMEILLASMTSKCTYCYRNHVSGKALKLLFQH